MTVDPTQDASVATMVAPGYSDRLDFQLPPFFRMAWATSGARDRWSGPLNDLADDVRMAEWVSVAADIRPAAIIAAPRARSAPLASEWSRYGLTSRVLDQSDMTRIRTFNGRMQNPTRLDEVHLVTRRGRMEEIEQIWRTGDPIRIADRLGYPPCCAAFLQKFAIEQRCVDTTWAIAQAYAGQQQGTHFIEINGCPVNPLLSPLGLRATPHRPCSFHCQATQSLAHAYGILRTKVAPQRTQRELEAVLAWPAEWSSLHGIIEVKLPVLKFCLEGDATASSYTVRLTGGELPEETAQGLDFPHIQPTRSPRRPDINQGISEAAGGDT